MNPNPATLARMMERDGWEYVSDGMALSVLSCFRRRMKGPVLVDGTWARNDDWANLIRADRYHTEGGWVPDQRWVEIDPLVTRRTGTMTAFGRFVRSRRVYSETIVEAAARLMALDDIAFAALWTLWEMGR